MKKAAQAHRATLKQKNKPFKKTAKAKGVSKGYDGRTKEATPGVNGLGGKPKAAGAVLGSEGLMRKNRQTQIRQTKITRTLSSIKAEIAKRPPVLFTLLPLHDSVAVDTFLIGFLTTIFHEDINTKSREKLGAGPARQLLEAQGGSIGVLVQRLLEGRPVSVPASLPFLPSRPSNSEIVDLNLALPPDDVKNTEKGLQALDACKASDGLICLFAEGNTSTGAIDLARSHFLSLLYCQGCPTTVVGCLCPSQDILHSISHTVAAAPSSSDGSSSGGMETLRKVLDAPSATLRKKLAYRFDIAKRSFITEFGKDRSFFDLTKNIALSAAAASTGGAATGGVAGAAGVSVTKGQRALAPLLRHLKSRRQEDGKGVSWRQEDVRAFMLARGAALDETRGLLRLWGHSRGHGCFSPRYPVHVTGIGDFPVLSVHSCAQPDQDENRTRNENGNALQQQGEGEIRDERQEGVFNFIWRPFLDPRPPCGDGDEGEDDLEDLAQGFEGLHVREGDKNSIDGDDTTDESDSQGESEREIGMEGDGEVRLGAGASRKDGRELDGESTDASECGEGQDEDEERAPLEGHFVMRKKCEMEYPDEVDTPNNKPATEHFKKYRLLANYASSPWEEAELVGEPRAAFEGLVKTNAEERPDYYDTISWLKPYRPVMESVMKNAAAKADEMAAEGEHLAVEGEDSEKGHGSDGMGGVAGEGMGDVLEEGRQGKKKKRRADEGGRWLRNLICTSLRIPPEILAQPLAMDKLRAVVAGGPIVVSTLLMVERKVSVNHAAVKKFESLQDTHVPSKSEFLVQCGFRRFAHPLSGVFSEAHQHADALSLDVRKQPYLHKSAFMRFLPPTSRGGKRSTLFTYTAPITAQRLTARTPTLLWLHTPYQRYLDDLSTTPSTALERSAPVAVASGSYVSADPDRLIIKRILLTGYAHKSKGVNVTVRDMFWNPTDVARFRKAKVFTLQGRQGHIEDALGTHGLMKCVFNRRLDSNETVCLPLYKRIFPPLNASTYWLPL